MNELNDKKLRAMLTDDLGDETDNLLETVQRLRGLPVPMVEAEQTAELITLLKANLTPVPSPFTERGDLAATDSLSPFTERGDLATSDSPSLSRPLHAPEMQSERGVGGEVKWQDWPPLLLMRAQLRVVQGEILIASALVMLLGVVVTLFMINMGTTYNPNLDLPIVLIAPIVAAVGLAFLYGTEVQAIAEIEHATPISPSLVLLARLTLVFGFDFVLGLTGSVVLTVIHPDLSLWPLVGSWLAPMTFLSALAFLISVLFVDPLVGTVISFGLWVALIMIRFTNANPFLRPLLNLPDLLASSTRPWLLILAVPLFIVALLINRQRDLIIKGTP